MLTVAALGLTEDFADPTQMVKLQLLCQPFDWQVLNLAEQAEVIRKHMIVGMAASIKDSNGGIGNLACAHVPNSAITTIFKTEPCLGFLLIKHDQSDHCLGLQVCLWWLITVRPGRGDKPVAPPQ